MTQHTQAPTRRYGIDRRDFLRYMAAVSAIPTLATAAQGQTNRPAKFASYPFTLGVASGDPASDSVVIWTRLATDPLRGGLLSPEPVSVQWEVARGEALPDVVQN